MLENVGRRNGALCYLSLDINSPATRPQSSLPMRSQTSLRRVTRSDLVLHQPLPWSLYDESGHLLLKSGFVLTIPRHIETLLDRGACIGMEGPLLENDRSLATSAAARPQATKANGQTAFVASPLLAIPVFQRIEGYAQGVRRIHRAIAEKMDSRVNISEYFGKLAVEIIDAVDEDADAFIAGTYLLRHSFDYRSIHQVMGAGIAAILARIDKHIAEERRALVCAALTRDIGLATFDRELSEMRGLTDGARRAIAMHPQLSVTYLQENGVNDSYWLECVADHHERLDGSGYPSEKIHHEIHVGAQILAVADSYASMVLPSTRRPPMLPVDALRDLFAGQGRTYSPKVFAQFFKWMGRYPPGTLVKLNNDEVGVVYRRSSDGLSDTEAESLGPERSDAPPVFSLFDRNQMLRGTPVRVHINGEIQVQASVSPDTYKSAMVTIKRLWADKANK